MDHVTATVERNATELRKHAEETNKVLVEAMSKAHNIQLDKVAKLTAKVAASEPLVERVASLEYGVQELLERLKDPDAGRACLFIDHDFFRLSLH